MLDRCCCWSKSKIYGDNSHHRSPVVVEDLCKHPRVPVEEVLVEHRVVVGQGLGQPGQPRGRDLLEGGLVGLEPDPAHVEGDPVLAVHVVVVVVVGGGGGGGGASPLLQYICEERRKEDQIGFLLTKCLLLLLPPTPSSSVDGRAIWIRGRVRVKTRMDREPGSLKGRGHLCEQ